MSSIPEPGKHEKPHTYVVQDRNNTEELVRLTIQDQAATKLMGGVLTEQKDLSIFHSVLDVGCATGGWAIELAQQYPMMKVVGVDISDRMVRYAQQRAEEAGVADRVSFQVMDVLQGLNLRDSTFDLVNVRLSMSYVRTWDWKNFLYELQRVVRPSGVVRLTEWEVSYGATPAVAQWCGMLVTAMYQAGRLFEPTATGLLDHMEELFAQADYQYIQQKEYLLEYDVNTDLPEAQAFSDDLRYSLRTLYPFLKKFGAITDDYDALCQQALTELQQPDFYARVRYLTVWGTKRDHSVKSPTRREYTLPAALNPGPTEIQSTYFVYDRHNQNELKRLMVQDQLLTEGMGGVLPEQSDPAQFRLVLDVGCGTGRWAIELARHYPTIRVAGVDINGMMVRYACEQVEQAQVGERVKIYLMDVLRHLDFRDAMFDLVNVRFCVSYVRKWEWEKLLGELQRVLRPGGVVRITEPDILCESSSSALLQLNRMLQCAFDHAGSFFEDGPTGITAHLAEQLKLANYQQIQTKSYTLEYPAGTPAWQNYAEDMRHSFSNLRPFLKKHGCMSQEYDQVYQRALQELQENDFYSRWTIMTAWAMKHSDSILYRE